MLLFDYRFWTTTTQLSVYRAKDRWWYQPLCSGIIQTSHYHHNCHLAHQSKVSLVFLIQVRHKVASFEFVLYSRRTNTRIEYDPKEKCSRFSWIWCRSWKRTSSKWTKCKRYEISIISFHADNIFEINRIYNKKRMVENEFCSSSIAMIYVSDEIDSKDDSIVTE